MKRSRRRVIFVRRVIRFHYAGVDQTNDWEDRIFDVSLLRSRINRGFRGSVRSPKEDVLRKTFVPDSGKIRRPKMVAR